ncbi:MAG: hypothetical protein ABI904_23250 [Chloroflexota bacterium]
MPDELITMAKNGEQLDVHPTAVQAHIGAGWHVVPLSETVSIPVKSEPLPVEAVVRTTGKKSKKN